MIKLINTTPSLSSSEVAGKVTAADLFKRSTAKKYIFDLDGYVSAVGPNYHLDSTAKRQAALCQFQITFLDGSTIDCIMTSRQRDYLARTSFWPAIKTVGGKGYRKVA